MQMNLMIRITGSFLGLISFATMVLREAFDRSAVSMFSKVRARNNQRKCFDFITQPGE